MKGAVKRMCRSLGLVPAGELDRTAIEARRASERVRVLEERLARLRADAETWKRRHEEVAAKLASCRTALSESQAEAAEARAGVDHAKARLRDWKMRANALSDEKHALRSRLEEAQRVAIAAREYLMATETKLDLIEAAIHVLDLRSRDTAVRSS